MIQKILTEPNNILRKKSQEVTEFNESLFNLLRDLRDTLNQTSGVGISAIQIGVPLRVFLMKSKDKKKIIEVINPVITSRKGFFTYNEGCLSIPEVFEEVERSRKITVSFFNRECIKKKKTFKEFESILFQHELEHLNGGLFIDNL